METEVLLTSYRLIARYALTRLVTARIAALAALLTVVSVWISTSQSPYDFGKTALLVCLLISQFRLWDDLADYDFDRLHHPDRILVTSHDTGSYWVLFLSLSLVSAAWIGILQPLPQLVLYVLLVAGFAVIYRRKRWDGQWRLVRTQVVLIKYPVFLYLCSNNAALGRLGIGGIALYLLLSIIDLLSDNTLRATSARRWLLSIEISALIVILVTHTWPIPT